MQVYARLAREPMSDLRVGERLAVGRRPFHHQREAHAQQHRPYEDAQEAEGQGPSKDAQHGQQERQRAIKNGRIRLSDPLIATTP
jgi:hypothetical protein